MVTSFGSPFSRGRSNSARMSHHGDPIEDKVMVSEMRSSTKKPSGTPMKMLIAQEMSKEMNSNHSSPSLVAKLMGLDAFPELPQRNRSRSYSESHLATPLGKWQREHGLDIPMQREIHQCPEQNEYEDTAQVWKQPEKGYLSKRDARAKRRQNEKKMDIVRQTFIEAKRLSTDAKLRQSKQFHDALEVLSSNKELFLKFLQEPNSMFSEHLYDLLSVPRPSETKHITVIRPSEIMDSQKTGLPRKKNEKKIEKASPLSWDVVNHSTQLARIVLLKPGSVTHHEAKSMLSTPSSSPRKIDEEAPEFGESEKESTMGVETERNGTPLSSVFSNGYTGDESSFHKSENEFAIGDLSDSEAMSPSSKHSWVYNNRFDSPYTSSFSQASCSPESSVCREAKRRLSERWALMASNRNLQEQRHVRRSSSTLGEMLALSNFESFEQSKEEDGHNKQEPYDSASCSTADIICDKAGTSSSGILLRSKSLPASTSVLGDRTNIESSDDTPKELPKSRATKSPRRGNIWSLLFSRGRKPNKDKSSTSGTKHDGKDSSGTHPSSAVIANDVTKEGGGCSEDGSLQTLQGSWSNTTSPDLSGIRPMHGTYAPQAALLATKSTAAGNTVENQEQPSPVSVLEVLFQENECVSVESCDTNEDKLGSKLCKSSLVDKSPPIESIARTLSWDDSSVDTSESSPEQPSSSHDRIEKEELQWFSYVQSLLSEAGLDGDTQADSFLARWHSPDSPLDPLLRQRLIDQDGQEDMKRQQTITQKLVFDCVNATLMNLTRHRSDIRSNKMSCHVVQKKALVDQVWARIKESFLFESRCVSVDSGEDCSYVLEMLVRKEVVGLGWAGQMKMETDEIAKEIEGKLLEEMVEQAVAESVGRVW